MIACDMDGIITNFSLGFSKVVNSLTNGRAPLVTSYDQVKSWQWKPWYWKEGFTNKLNEKAWDWIHASPTFWRDLEPLFPDDMAYLASIARTEPVVFMTRREGLGAWEQTVLWLQNHGIEEPLVVRVRSGEEKWELCQRMGIQVLIDDNPKTLEAAKEAGMDVVTVSWPYNEHLLEVTRGYSLGTALGYSVWVAGLD